jgi:hypothetical protein
MNPREELQIRPVLSEDLIDQMAKRLSVEQRAEYYRILRHCRSLPENDEMLLVLNAIQLLFALIADVPNRMGTEREKLEQLFPPMLRSQEKMVHTIEDLQAHFDQRLDRLPEDIAKYIQPEVIAAKITESLRQQFAQTTIPETAKLIRAGVDEINTAGTEFRSGTKAILKNLNDAMTEANGFLTKVRSVCIDAIERIASAAERVASILEGSYAGLVFLACSVTLVAGLMLGIFIHSRWTSSLRPVEPAPTQQLQAAPMAPARDGRPKAPSHQK